MSQATQNAIVVFRLLAIKGALSLEVRTGLKHSRNSPTLAARQILEAAGRKAPRVKEALLREFARYIEDQRRLLGE